MSEEQETMRDLEERLMSEARDVMDVEAGDLTELKRAVGRRARAERLLDVAYVRIDSPFGELLAVSTPKGLVHLGYPNREVDEQLERLAARISPRILEVPSAFEALERQLDEYFAGERKRFELPIDWQLSSGFAREILRQTAKIPYGQTRTYGEMAESVGRPRAFRAAGTALGSNSIPIVVPCHRVLRSGGALGGYGGGLEVKEKLLELEGVLEERG